MSPSHVHIVGLYLGITRQSKFSSWNSPSCYTHQSNCSCHQTLAIWYFHTLGTLLISNIDSLDEPECLDSITSMPLCLHPSTNLDHSVFSSNLVIPPALLPNEWIIDNGATDHMVHSISYLTKITFVAHISVKIPNGVFVLATHVGQVQLSCDLILDNVLCVPSFSFNLISIGKLTHYLRCCCIFLSQFCFIQDLL